MRGTASVLLTPNVISYLVNDRSDEVNIISEIDFGDGLRQVTLSHDRLPSGYNGQTELFFMPWPHGEIRFRREADTSPSLLPTHPSLSLRSGPIAPVVPRNGNHATSSSTFCVASIAVKSPQMTSSSSTTMKTVT